MKIISKRAKDRYPEKDRSTGLGKIWQRKDFKLKSKILGKIDFKSEIFFKKGI